MTANMLAVSHVRRLISIKQLTAVVVSFFGWFDAVGGPLKVCFFWVKKTVRVQKCPLPPAGLGSSPGEHEHQEEVEIFPSGLTALKKKGG